MAGPKGPPVFFGSLACLAIIFFFWRRTDSIPLEPIEPIPTDLCDPFAEPGFLHYDKTQPKSARWIPFAEACDPAPDWLALFDARDTNALSFLANRTILVLGDSVDRNGLEHLAVMLGLPRYSVPYDDFSKKGQVPAGWDERGIPWIVEVPWLDLTFTNGFMYGLDDEDNFRQQPDWHPPGMAEERVDKLFKVHTDQLKYPPSFISIHSGRASDSNVHPKLPFNAHTSSSHSLGPSFLRPPRPCATTLYRDSIDASAYDLVAREDDPPPLARQHNLPRRAHLDAETSSSRSRGRC
ncbi:hypothetical protein P7C70_g2107, partial [Phenoliferia sp. Uapishka_3]